MANGQTFRSPQRAWNEVVPSSARSRTNRRRQLTDDDRRLIVAGLERALADGWLPMFQIMAHPAVPTAYVETQVRRVLDDLTAGPDPKFRVHAVPEALPANYWTLISNQRPFTDADIIIRRKRRDHQQEEPTQDDASES